MRERREREGGRGGEGEGGGRGGGESFLLTIYIHQNLYTAQDDVKIILWRKSTCDR